MSRDTREELERIEYIMQYIAPVHVRHVKTAINFIMVILGWLSVTLEVFIRREFGERYLSWLRLYIGANLLGLLFFLPILLQGLDTELGDVVIYIVICILFLFLSIYHRLRIHRRNRLFPWHSKCFGMSRLKDIFAVILYIGNYFFFVLIGNFLHKLFTKDDNEPFKAHDFVFFERMFPVEDKIFYGFIEPAICFYGGMVLYAFEELAGVWLMLASIALLMKNQMSISVERDRELDARDAEIEARYRSEAAQGKPMRETAGLPFVTVPRVPSAPLEEPPDIEATVRETLA